MSGAFIDYSMTNPAIGVKPVLAQQLASHSAKAAVAVVARRSFRWYFAVDMAHQAVYFSCSFEAY